MKQLFFCLAVISSNLYCMEKDFLKDEIGTVCKLVKTSLYFDNRINTLESDFLAVQKEQEQDLDIQEKTIEEIESLNDRLLKLEKSHQNLSNSHQALHSSKQTIEEAEIRSKALEEFTLKETVDLNAQMK